MEDALISPEGFMILSGAGLTEATEKETIKQHITSRTSIKTAANGVVTIELPNTPYFGANAFGEAIVIGETETDLSGAKENYCYVMMLDGDDVCSEPFIPDKAVCKDGKCTLTLKTTDDVYASVDNGYQNPFKSTGFVAGDPVMVDYYIERESGAQQIDITPDKFGGNYYLEASTLFRDRNGVDMPAEFIIPNCKIQSNFTFSMASSGDPSSFTFTMDAFPDYTRFNNKKKVLAAVQIISELADSDKATRLNTKTVAEWDEEGNKIKKQEVVRTSAPNTVVTQASYSTKKVVSD